MILRKTQTSLPSFTFKINLIYIYHFQALGSKNMNWSAKRDGIIALIGEKKKKLERIRVHRESLERSESDQNDLIASLNARVKGSLVWILYPVKLFLFNSSLSSSFDFIYSGISHIHFKNSFINIFGHIKNVFFSEILVTKCVSHTANRLIRKWDWSTFLHASIYFLWYNYISLLIPLSSPLSLL